MRESSEREEENKGRRRVYWLERLVSVEVSSRVVKGEGEEYCFL